MNLLNVLENDFSTEFSYIASHLFIAVISAVFIFLLLGWYYFYYFINSLKRDKKIVKGKIKFKYAVLVPARNEDKVISNLLESLKKQNYPKEFFDVYVIVESKDDPTIKITKKYGYKIILRKDLINKRTKGFALDEAYQEIRRLNLNYDAFMVFDADNVLNSDYIELMNDVKNQGYKVGMGYRNFTNASYNWVSACSATLFAYMNQYTSKGRCNLFKKMTLTGTGYYIDKDIIDNEGSWIFNGMTEDVELTRYCYSHNINMRYYPIAQYYDEQPVTMKVVHKQHIRWVWGYFANHKKFTKKYPDYRSQSEVKRKISLFEFNVSIYPIVCMVILLTLAFLISFCLFLASIGYYFIYTDFSATIIFTMFIWMLFYFICLTFPFSLLTFVIFLISNKFLNFSFKTKFMVSISYIYYLFDFLFAFIDGLFHKYKRVSWDKIEHKGDITNKEALKNLEKNNK